MAFEDNNPQAGETKRTGFTFRGKEVILTKTSGRPRTGITKKAMDRGIFPEQKKIEAATVYAVTGSIQKTAELAKLPESTVTKWRREDWFKELVREVWVENNERLDAKYSEILEKSQSAIIDRLDNGDFHVTRTGELVRKPISAKELSLVHAINFDKRQLNRGLPTSRTETTANEKGVSRLERLAQTFENFAKFGRQPKVLEVKKDEVVVIEDAG